LSKKTFHIRKKSQSKKIWALKSKVEHIRTKGASRILFGGGGIFLGGVTKAKLQKNASKVYLHAFLLRFYEWDKKFGGRVQSP